MKTAYQDFLATKIQRVADSGFDIEESRLNPQLFDFQKYCVRWTLKRGRAAIFAGCGNGKTLMQLEWAQKVAERESLGTDTCSAVGEPSDNRSRCDIRL